MPIPKGNMHVVSLTTTIHNYRHSPKTYVINFNSHQRIIQHTKQPDNITAQWIERSDNTDEMIKHAIFGYFCQRSGLLVHLEDSYLT